MREHVSQQRVAFGQEPIVLVGPPRRCEGFLVVHNPQKNPIKLKRITLQTGAQGLANTCERGAIELRSRSNPTLCPGDSQQVRVSAQLPPSTPPGSYEATLEGAEGRCQPVTIQVLESRRMQLAPSSVMRGVRPCETFQLRVHASNEGNVPLVIPRHAAVSIHALDRGWPQHVHAAARSHGGQGAAPFLDNFAARFGANEPAPGRAKIRVGAGPLAPLETRLIEVEISLPRKLRARRRYQAVVRLADASLVITLYVDVADAPVEEPPVIS
jgi:hypothetical protein